MTKIEELELLVSEEDAINQLKARLPTDTDQNIINDTYQLYLYLQDQHFDVNETEKLITKMLEWRKKMRLDTIEEFKPSEVIKNYFANTRIACDKKGSIVHYIPLGKLDPKGIYMSAKFPDLERTLIQVLEEDIKIVKSKRKTPNGPHPSTIHIYDMEGLTFANATDKKGLEYMIRALQIYENYYPWLLSSVYIINISSYFMIPLSIVKSCLSRDKLEQAKFFGADGWKDELLKLIDTDQLPAFLGGNKTDPDGSPLCKTIVMQGGKIDEKSYIHKSKNPLANSPGVKKLVLARASFYEMELEVKENGSLIEWEFETKTRDVGFGLFYKETVDGGEQMKEIVPLLRINAEDYSETGIYKCEKSGTYVILFDNSYSWIRSKEIYYRTKIVTSKEHQAELQS